MTNNNKEVYVWSCIVLYRTVWSFHLFTSSQDWPAVYLHPPTMKWRRGMSSTAGKINMFQTVPQLRDWNSTGRNTKRKKENVYREELEQTI